MSRRLIAAVALYALLAILVVPIYPHFISANEFSRWLLAAAIVDEHTVEVTRVVATTSLHNEDLAEVDGRLYSNKAPGATLVALPAYAMTPRDLRVSLDAMRLLASTLPVVLLALWFARVSRSVFATVALLFGTPLFAYGLLFFAHALSAFALFGAFVLLFRPATGEPRPITAGILLGIATICEYPNVVPALVLIACAIPRLRGRTIAVIAGGLPFAIILAFYNHLAFGSILSLSSAHESNPFYRSLAVHALFGIGLPSPLILLRLLFDPAKGLFVFSPVLLLTFFGIGAAYRAMPRDSFVALVAAPIAIIVTFAGYPNWHGGWTVGARYLVPALPFLALLIAFARETLLGYALLGASIVAVALVSLVFPFVGVEYPMPWTTFAWPLLRDGHSIPTMLPLLPFALVAVAIALGLPRRALLPLTAGMAVWFAVGLLFHPSPNIRLVVEQAYFEDPTAIARGGQPRDRQALEAIARDLLRRPPHFSLR